MDKIELQNTLPCVFEGREVQSDIWLQDVTFQKGETILVEASSGTGKSSLCSYIIGYRKDYLGKILFDDRDIRQYGVSDWTAIRKHTLSLLFQELRLFPELTAMENVQLKNRLTGYKTDEEIERMLTALMPADKRDQPVRTLSLGQRQRVAAVRALCQPFRFLMLDEPFSHIDRDNARLVADLILSEVERQKAGLIVTALDPIDLFPFDKMYRL